MRLTKRTLLGAGLAVLTAPLASPILGLPAALADDANAPLVIGTNQVPRHFNGAVQSGIATGMVSTQIFASPLRYDDAWNPLPYLAKFWEVAPDNLSVTLHLVSDAVFHDGHPLTSEDVAFSIGVIKANHPFQTMLEPVSTVETPDAHTVVIRLSRPHPALLLAMSPGLMPILPKHVYGDGQDIKTHPANLKPVGSGPFKFVAYKQGESIQLERFDKFFIAGRPKLARLVYRILPDQNSLVIATERREIGMLPFLSSVRDIERLSKAQTLTVTDRGFEGIGPINWLAFNCGKKPLDDVRVRRAIALAANRDFITGKLLGGVAKPATGPIVPGSPFYEPAVDPYKLDIAKAESLLDEAGLKKGADGTRLQLTIDYIPNDNDQQRNVAEYLRAGLKRIGIALQVRAAPDFPTWAQRVSNFDFDLTMDNVFNWGDPVIGVARTYLSTNIRKGVIWSNTQQYQNPKVDELLNAAAIETDVAKRKTLYDDFQKIVVSDAPIAYLNLTPYKAVYDKRLTNLPLSIWGPLSPLDEVAWAQGAAGAER
ncbi:ABC transporter substrate-binding protein [Methylobacterium sp. WL64]|uniref:ABC transporter substrate-binding protein n=1 Tax=Methylobacterium sp. WL64 TaxID=2603894 RepID=UPI0011C9F4FF|nr:ABC transporter substrate-binding protein [Methylobacterium sp. WL64]TXM96943.1 ABC transporter substrate-binding protein [Methylobacterium sp. WL64]